MISQKSVVKKLRLLGYAFKGRCKSDRNEKWRKAGSTHFVFLPRQDWLAELWVRTTLRQCGASQEEIDALVAGQADKAPPPRRD